MKKSISNSLYQVFLIVFSVVLGLFLSERIEEFKNEREAENLLSKIKSEVNDNKALVENWAPYHQEIVKKLDSLSNDLAFIDEFSNNKVALFEKAFTRGTLMSVMPTNEAWDIAKSNPLIVNLEYDQLLVLSKIYNQQELTFEPFTKISEVFLIPDFNSKSNARINMIKLKNLIREIAAREMTLINYFNQAESILKLEDK
ncbi:MAG: hypothetical protein AAF688_14050 [Bacteroidota bacterium]